MRSVIHPDAAAAQRPFIWSAVSNMSARLPGQQRSHRIATCRLLRQLRQFQNLELTGSFRTGVGSQPRLSGHRISYFITLSFHQEPEGYFCHAASQIRRHDSESSLLRFCIAAAKASFALSTWMSPSNTDIAVYDT